MRRRPARALPLRPPLALRHSLTPRRQPSLRRRLALGRGLTLAPLLALALFAPWTTLEAQGVREAFAQFRSGEYDEAISALRRLAALEGEAPAGVPVEFQESAHFAYVAALAEVGRYEEALAVGADAPEALSVTLANTIGEILYAVGRLDEAREYFDRAWEGGAHDRNVARLNRAILDWTYGDREQALREFDSFIDLYNDAATLSSGDLTAIATAVRYLGIGDPQLFKDALKAYDEAIAADPRNLDARVLLGELFLEKFDGTEADASLKAALALNPNHPRALLAMARAMEFNGTVGVIDQVKVALENNPNLVAGRVFKAWLHLGVQNHDEARTELEAALQVNPVSLEALSALAASHYLHGEINAYEEVRDRVLALSPGYGDLYNDIAELSVKSRKYHDAAELAAEAIKIEPQSWRAYGILGANQLRLGQMDEGRANLDVAFEGDPYSAWFFNSLTLLDSFEHFEVVDEDPRFEYVLHEREAEILKPYIEQIATEALESLIERYGGYTPPLPVRIEVFPSHTDFSVRTLGLPGIGALGVTFGSVVAMDSPSSKPMGDFNWASVLWHEMAHVFHLGLTEHEVPRWFSEGLAVYEQRRARPGWGHQPSPGFLSRYQEGLMLPVSQMNAGFVQPSYPQQVVDSYLQASLVFDFIEGRWGFEPILQMLHGYRNRESTPALVERLLDIEMEDLDRDFDDYFRRRYESALNALAAPAASAGMTAQPSSIDNLLRLARENPENFRARLTAGVTLFQADRLDEAEEHLRAALRLFPEYGGLDSPYWFLAQIHHQRGEARLAAAALARQTALNESHYDAFLLHAELLDELGDADGAAAALDAAVLIYPYEIELHERLARAHADRGDSAGAVRERRAVVALEPTDRAGAFYLLAHAYWADGRMREARRAVLQSLEIAPNYEEALNLLLEIRAGGAS